MCALLDFEHICTCGLRCRTHKSALRIKGSSKTIIQMHERKKKAIKLLFCCLKTLFRLSPIYIYTQTHTLSAYNLTINSIYTDKTHLKS